MNFSRIFLSLSIISFFLFSCGEKNGNNSADSMNSNSIGNSNGDSMHEPSFPSTQNIEAKTFPVTDDAGKSTGWGYDLYVDGKRSIHQPIFPGLRGNSSFQSEEDAMKMGQLAANRMKTTGSLPTVVPNDFDSLGIKLPPDLQHIVDSLVTAEKTKK
jgi:hypothetical protein